MASRSISPPSEGEIVESDSEKAHKSQPSTHDMSVDRQSRKKSSPLPSVSSHRQTHRNNASSDDSSRSPSPIRRDITRDSRSYRASRSRSPYRDSRGHKRQRGDDHYSGGRERYGRGEGREHRSVYDDRRYDGKNSGRSYHRDGERSSYGSRYEENRRPSGGAPEKRMRTVSRSPPRFSNKKGYRPRENNRSDTQSKGGRYSREQSVGDSGNHVSSSKTNAEAKNFQTQQNGSTKPVGESAADKATNGVDDVPMEDAEPLDEAALIEQRRKRREAIKAKHRTQPTPLLVQALTLNAPNTPTTSQPDTPSSLSQDLDSPKVSPTETPKEGSAPASPTNFEFVKDSDLANDTLQEDDDLREDEPSAADYDPTLDMQEDKLRHDHRNQEEVSSSAYDETKNNRQDVLIPDNLAEKPAVKKVKNEFDMFAEDDEDDEDMFANDAAKAIPVPKANAIDMSMLDDFDDEEGYYKIILGELLDSRYHVQLNLGKGMFSGVVRAMDQQTKKLVAIKIIRSNETMKKAALKEIEILGTLKQADPEDKKHVIRLERYFEHKGHLCMVFENLSINLREVLKKFGRGVGINLKAVRAYAHQMFLGLSLLRKCNILHADLKPDNVLVNESRNMLKICDLGSASDASENEITPYLVSRFYRAPEIILGMPYDFAIDTWSIGCTLFELYTGKILFTGRTNNQMLRSIMECRGKFSVRMLKKASFAGLHFDDMGNFRSVETDKLSGKDVVRILNLAKPTRDLRTRLMTNSKEMADVEVKELNLFVDLLERCLNLNPEKRCTPVEALKHPFIMRSKM